VARFQNRLNDLTPREWIRFQKSWFIHNPPRRGQGVLHHPAKYPESLAAEFISFFTKRGGIVLDPMVGTGSTLVAAALCGRRAIGVDLNQDFVALSRERAAAACLEAGQPVDSLQVIEADARRLLSLGLPQVDYCLTSPPYWDMLRRKGFETQAERRAKALPLTYSNHPEDLGNIDDYQQFVDGVADVYRQVHELLIPGGYLTVIVKNVKKGSRMYPLAWDIARALDGLYTLKDERIWCQDDQRLAPYGMFNAWVSNTHHHYCLMFRK